VSQDRNNNHAYCRPQLSHPLREKCTHCFKGIALLTAFAARNRVCLSLVITEVQSGISTLQEFKVTPILARGRGVGKNITRFNMSTVVRLGSLHCATN